MPNVKVTNLIKFATLMHLYHKPMHGYDLIKMLEVKMKRKISASQVYPFLRQLSRNRLVKHNKEGNRDKKKYSLTPKGKRFIKETLSKFGEIIDASISNNITKCWHCGCNVYKGRFSKSVKGKKRNFCCKYCAMEYK